VVLFGVVAPISTKDGQVELAWVADYSATKVSDVESGLYDD